LFTIYSFLIFDREKVVNKTAYPLTNDLLLGYNTIKMGENLNLVKNIIKIKRKML